MDTNSIISCLFRGLPQKLHAVSVSFLLLVLLLLLLLLMVVLLLLLVIVSCDDVASSCLCVDESVDDRNCGCGLNLGGDNGINCNLSRRVSNDGGSGGTKLNAAERVAAWRRAMEVGNGSSFMLGLNLICSKYYNNEVTLLSVAVLRIAHFL